MSYWWDKLDEEKYWVEITDRKDIGCDLNCPQTDDSGKPEGSYSLIKTIKPGDVVFHYSTRKQRIEGASVAGGPLEERVTTWIPHGRVGRLKPIHAQRPGWWLPIYGFSEAQDKLTLAEVRQPDDKDWIYQWIHSKELEIQSRRKSGERKLQKAIAAPFQRYGGHTLRAQQGYLTKMPVDFINRWTKLSDTVDALSTEQEQLSVLAEVCPFDEAVGSLDGVFVPKSAADYEVEIKSGTQRRTRKHERLVNEAATILTSLGAIVSSAHPIDLLIFSPLMVIVEAKIGFPNARYAIRHALGQLHEYRYFLKHFGAKLCVLLDQKPDDALIAYAEIELQLMVAWVSDGVLAVGPSTKKILTDSGMIV